MIAKTRISTVVRVNFGIFVTSWFERPAQNVQSPRGMARDGRQSLGKAGEDLACAALVRRGYAILERRYRTRYGEIDIVARVGGSLVFVEVKTRVSGEFGGGEEAVTVAKQRRIVRMAIDYLTRHELLDRPCRFDVVTIHLKDGRPMIEVYPHAFAA
jgi:putative endonuclease